MGALVGEALEALEGRAHLLIGLRLAGEASKDFRTVEGLPRNSCKALEALSGQW